MSAPTTMSDPPVAQAGILAKIGAKKIDRKKNSATKTDVRPVRLPTSIPAALSMYEVMGERPKSDPTMVARASVLNAVQLLGLVIPYRDSHMLPRENGLCVIIQQQ